MKITFPHMGTTFIPIKMILDELNIEVILPPKSNKRALELGVKCSPEAICVPFKIITGNILEGIEKGADTVFMLTGCGPCRFGIFHALQREIIHDMGHDVEFLTADRFSNYEGLREFSQRLKEASPQNSYIKIIRTIKKGLKVLDEVDTLYELTNKLRPRELNKGEVDYIWAQFENDIRTSYGYKEVMHVIKKYHLQLKEIEVDYKKPCLKVAIVGEIYTILENYINLNIERKLGNMGIEAIRTTSASEFVREQLDFIPFMRSQKKKIYKAASKYLDIPIGGHAINSIGNIMRAVKNDYDGVIHLLPFTCMPEIVVQSILPTIEKEQNIPIMTLVLDEMTGEGGYITRLEAFVDLIQKRREMKNEGKSFSWY
ncbi:CoA protein activase [Mycoplasmatota bacterium]|nr:CoA protein activase [Mycoplasmatota bacterium]